jgi:hypothetical protein
LIPKVKDSPISFESVKVYVANLYTTCVQGKTSGLSFLTPPGQHPKLLREAIASDPKLRVLILDPHNEFQKFKLHPRVQQIIEAALAQQQ